MHLFDWDRRFLGGYGIVGGSLPLSAGVALACDYLETEDVILSMMGDGATNQGTFGETMNLAALWKLPVVFVIINNQFGMGTALHRHSAVTDLSLKSEGFGVPGTRCDGMDVLDVHSVVTERAALRARGAQAAARRGRHLPLPRPLDGRPRGVPHQGRGRGVARARPDQGVRRPPRRRGRARRRRTSSASTRRRSRPSTRPSSSPTSRPSPTSTRSTTTSTSSTATCPPGGPSTSARPRCTAASASARPARCPHQLAEQGAAYARRRAPVLRQRRRGRRGRAGRAGARRAG